MKNIEKPSIAAVLEYSLWGLALLSVAGMLISMPWVGPDKLIPPETWLGGSLLGILLFGTLALLIRLVFSPWGSQMDTAASDRFEERDNHG